MKGIKVGSTIFNVFWVIFVGIWAAIESAIMGVMYCITIIGIPFGKQYLKFVKLVFAPAGKVVATRYGKHPVMNTIWALTGGLVSLIFYCVLAVICMATIVGIPVGLQLLKIATFMFAPFGCEIVEDGEYTSAKDTNYDAKLAMRRMLTNPDVLTDKLDASGEPMTVKQIVQMDQRIVPAVKRYRMIRMAGPVLLAVMMMFTLVVTMRNMSFPAVLGISAVFILLGAAVCFLQEAALMKPTRQTMLWLTNYYPANSEIDKRWAHASLEHVVKEFGLTDQPSQPNFVS